jgi:hypothetical protein
MLDKTLPLWLAQEGVDLEILIAVGPDIKRIEHPRITYYNAPGKWEYMKIAGCKLCESFNLLWPKTKGEQVFITYSDMAMPNPNHLAIMLAAWKPGRMVTHSLGEMDCGIWTHGMLADRKLIEKSGGWDNFYDDGGWAYEDSDFVSGLLAAGGEFHILKERKDGLYHIDHPRPPDSPTRGQAYYRNKCHYHSKYPDTVMHKRNRGEFPQYEA